MNSTMTEFQKDRPDEHLVRGRRGYAGVNQIQGNNSEVERETPKKHVSTPVL